MSAPKWTAANVAVERMRVANGGRDLSARQWAAVLVPILRASRPVLEQPRVVVHTEVVEAKTARRRADEGFKPFVRHRDQQVPHVFGAPTFRNVLLRGGEHV